jgi:hypothetical protein
MSTSLTLGFGLYLPRKEAIALQTFEKNALQKTANCKITVKNNIFPCKTIVRDFIHSIRIFRAR